MRSFAIAPIASESDAYIVRAETAHDAAIAFCSEDQEIESAFKALVKLGDDAIIIQTGKNDYLVCDAGIVSPAILTRSF